MKMLFKKYFPPLFVILETFCVKKFEESFKLMSETWGLLQWHLSKMTSEVHNVANNLMNSYFMVYPLDLLKLNTKTQNIFCFVNENLMTFLYTLKGGTRKQKEKKKVFSFKKYTKVECYQKKRFQYLVLRIWFQQNQWIN